MIQHIPELSVVVAARNDDHGGAFLKRMQLSVTGFLEQAKRFRLVCELIIVEWNPPPDRPRLKDALDWPSELGPCSVRIIEVPTGVHERYRYADRLLLYQMIAKNVGIRRARGRFVLATNVDLLFSDALIRFLASGKLDSEFIYRIDRYDVPSSIPLNRSLPQQLEYCRRNVIRINRRDGTFDSEAASRIALIKLTLLLRKLTEYALRFLPHPPHIKRPRFPHFNLRVKARKLRVKVESYLYSRGMRLLEAARFAREYFHPQYLRAFNYDRSQKSEFLLTSVRRNLEFFLPSFPHVTLRHRLRIPLPDVMEFINTRRKLLSEATEIAARYFRPPYPRLHTNACGDFTLLDRETWFALRGYPELDIFSFHVDSLLCHMAYHTGLKEKILKDPKRVYHIEHSAGWSAKQGQQLLQHMSAMGVSILAFPQFQEKVIRMQEKKSPTISNTETWGLGSEILREFVVESSVSRKGNKRAK